MKNIPFYPNSPDDTHCVQAAFGMILKTFLPGRDFELEELDKLTKKTPGKGTWWFPAIAEFKRMGLQVRIIERFDYQKFYNQGEKYLFEAYSSEIARWHLSNSNLTEVAEFIPEFLNSANIQKRGATLADLNELLGDGWLVALELNSCTLNDSDGFSAHMVVVFENKDDIYKLHDPGLPPTPNRQVTAKKLAKAWQYGGTEKASLVAIKPNNNLIV